MQSKWDELAKKMLAYKGKPKHDDDLDGYLFTIDNSTFLVSWENSGYDDTTYMLHVKKDGVYQTITSYFTDTSKFAHKVWLAVTTAANTHEAAERKADIEQFIFG